MKNRIIVAFVLLLCCMGCDVIDPPYKQKGGSGVDTTKAVQKVFIEDFTGFKCPNCPKAAIAAREIEAQFPGRVVVVAVHAGYFSEPDKTGPFTYDFRTEAGTALDNLFQISTVWGNPNGMVNRTRPFDGSSASSRVLAHTSWAAQVDSLLRRNPEVSMTLKSSFNSTSMEDTITVNMKYINEEDADNYLAVYVVEDSIIQYQVYKDNPDGPEEDPNYVHNHVLRGVVNGQWMGERISSTPISAGTTMSKTYVYKINSAWKSKHCRVIAYIHKYDQTYDPNSATPSRAFEVLQAEETEVNK